MVAIIVSVCSMIQYFTQIWHILNGLDFEGGRKIDIDQKFFFLDMDWLGPKGMTENITACEKALGNSNAVFIIFRQKLKDKVTMYKQGQVRLIKTHLPLSLLPPEMLNKCRWSKSLYFVGLTGLSGLVQGCLFVLWRRWISISHSLLWLWTLISITHSMPSGQGCVRWAEPKGRGSVLLPPPPAHQVLQFAICLCNLFLQFAIRL